MIRYVISSIGLSERMLCVHCMNITSAHVLIPEGPLLVTSLSMDIHSSRDSESPGRHFVIDGKYLHLVTITVDSDKDTDGALSPHSQSGHQSDASKAQKIELVTHMFPFNLQISLSCSFYWVSKT